LTFKDEFLEERFRASADRRMIRFAYEHHYIGVWTMALYSIIAALYQIVEPAASNPFFVYVMIILTVFQFFLYFLRRIHFSLTLPAELVHRKRRERFFRKFNRPFIRRLIRFFATGFHGYLLAISTFVIQVFTLLMFNGYSKTQLVSEACIFMIILYCGCLECADISFLGRSIVTGISTLGILGIEMMHGRVSMTGIAQCLLALASMAVSTQSMMISFKTGFAMDVTLSQSNQQLDEGWCKYFVLLCIYG
jgi:hypothetical protein